MAQVDIMKHLVDIYSGGTPSHCFDCSCGWGDGKCMGGSSKKLIDEGEVFFLILQDRWEA